MRAPRGSLAAHSGGKDWARARQIYDLSAIKKAIRLINSRLTPKNAAEGGCTTNRTPPCPTPRKPLTTAFKRNMRPLLHVALKRLRATAWLRATAPAAALHVVITAYACGNLA